MTTLNRSDLMSLEEYAAERPEFRRRVMELKRVRVLPVGPHVSLHFENRLIMQYQVQEMLRVERIFEAAGIEEELAAYNPLIPDGSNFKVTMMIEFSDPEERGAALAKLLKVEDKVWVRVGDGERVWAIADEDMERDTEDKTSSVHFLRLELSPEMVAAAKAGAAISVGVEHDAYTHSVDPVNEALRESLVLDLDGDLSGGRH
jgi:hypothetical protein